MKARKPILVDFSSLQFAFRFVRAYYGSNSVVYAQRQKTIFTKRPKSVPHRDAVAKDESAADRRAVAQIDRSSSASDACLCKA
eukprot:6174093-Pleurochrysis_carterae.AAC.1